MPTYEYICENCQHKFELFQSITASPKRKCPKCKNMKLKRLIGSGAAVIFKGTGFYQTDYRTESYKNGRKKAKSSPSKAADTAKTEKSEKAPKIETKKAEPAKTPVEKKS